MRYFLGIVGILGFHDFVFFPSCYMLILQSCTLVFRRVKNYLSSMDVGMIGRKTLKLSCTFFFISLSLGSLIGIFVHQSFRDS